MNGSKLLIKITDKWPAKVLSVAAALIITVFYRLSTLENRTFTVPLNIESSSDFILVTPVADSVRISLRGEANGILPILENDIEAYIDLDRYSKEGAFRVPVQIRKKGTLVGVEPLSVSVTPKEISVRLEQKTTRIIPVYPVFSGSVAQGYELKSQLIIPDSVSAQGPKSGLENILEFKTEPIDMEGRNSNFTALVNIAVDNPNITIHGNRMIEYSCVINRIERDLPSYEIDSWQDDGETND